MKKLTIYQTLDGQRFDHFKYAHIHADNQMSLALKNAATSFLKAIREANEGTHHIAAEIWLHDHTGMCADIRDWIHDAEVVEEELI